MENDYAVIIGLQKYPGLDINGTAPLSGAEKDALDFKGWILSTNHGNVNPENVKTILSSDYSPSTSIDDAHPAILEVIVAFDNLRRASNKNMSEGLGPKVGRRLYIFMSGHGIAPTPYGNRIAKEAALLMANADPTNITAPHYHLPGIYTLTWFCENNCFEEVFLFMDCCRDLTIVPSLNIYLPPKGNESNSKFFYAFATKWSRRAKENEDENGEVSGVFTRTLLKGLYGAAAEPMDGEQGIITAASLKSYLYQNMKAFIKPEFLSTEAQEPDVDYWPKEYDGKDIIVNTVPLQKFPVKLRLPSTASGSVQILFNGLQKVEELRINGNPELLTKLARGKYSALTAKNNNPEYKIFDVTGIESPGNEKVVDL